MAEKDGTYAKNLRVLILEDSAADSELMQRELEHAGFSIEILRVEDERSFLTGLRGFEPDIVLADYSLPSFDGRSALEICRREGFNIPFIFVSGAMGEELAIDLLKEGATDYVLKDRLARLSSAVDRALREQEEKCERRLAEEALRKAHDELELRVRERTSELASINAKLLEEIEERKRVETELGKAHGEMEKRVYERTRDLSQANSELQREIAERKRVETKLRKSQDRLRALTSQLSLAEERERRRLAMELHECLGQTLAIAKMKLGIVQESRSRVYHRKDLEEISHIVDQAIQDSRSLTQELTPPVLHELGVFSAIEWLTEKMEERFGVPIECEKTDGIRQPDHDIQILIYQSTRELIMNSIKHAKPARIKIFIREEGDRLRIEVIDDGVGFDTVFIDWSKGFGLFSILERLEYINGTLLVESEPGRGSRITMLVPFTLDAPRRRATDRIQSGLT